MAQYISPWSPNGLQTGKTTSSHVNISVLCKCSFNTIDQESFTSDAKPNDYFFFFPQHLATFLMDKNDSLGTVDDATKQLLQLESKDKIWAQEMVLQVMNTSISLLDCATQV